MAQPQNAVEKTRVLLVTGMSGAGKSSALKALEDIGYEAVDNLPLSLLPNFLKIVEDMEGNDSEYSPALAVGIDVRTRTFRREGLARDIEALRARDDLDLSVLFFDASNTVLSQRFTETRRRHPLADDRPVIDGLIRERQLMENLRAESDFIFDTSDLNVHELRRTVTQQFERDKRELMQVTISSFSYPRGLPRDADLVFDVRFLRNPHYDTALRPLTGLDKEVGEYIMADDNYNDFWTKISNLLLSLLPLYKREGKSYLTVAFGCTGGKHRSVFLAECLAQYLRQEGYSVNILHREVSRDRLDS